MGNNNTRRRYANTDEREFSDKTLATLRKAQEEIRWLLDRGYPIKNAVTFIGNHYLLSNRQRLALTRATAPTDSIMARKTKEVSTYSFRHAAFHAGEICVYTFRGDST